MKKKYLILFVSLIIVYPIISVFQLDSAISVPSGLERVQEKLRNYQVSIWISWLFLVIIAVYFKWSRQRNFFFTLTYGFLFLAFCVFGIYTQLMVNNFQIPSTFEDNYSLGIFTALQNIFVSIVLTGFLQGAVWWFTRRWHRR